MRRRASSRLLVLDPTQSLLLFHFSHARGALAGQAFWATPGGGLLPGESFADAGVRELLEETGITVASLGDPVHAREFPMTMPDGEVVLADERFFVVCAPSRDIARDRWTALEDEVMVAHRWWTAAELASTDEIIRPDNLAQILASIGRS